MALRQIILPGLNGSYIALLRVRLNKFCFWVFDLACIIDDKDKPILIEQARKWNEEKISDVLKKTYNIELQIKSNPGISKDLLIKNLIIELCVNATAS